MKHSMNTSFFDWIKHYPLAVSVCDRAGIIIAMNCLAEENFKPWGGRDLLGKSLFDCHPEAANVIIRRMLKEESANTYCTINKEQRKLVHQCPWHDSSGKFAGLVETIVPLPAEVPAFKRS